MSNRTQATVSNCRSPNRRKAHCFEQLRKGGVEGFRITEAAKRIEQIRIFQFECLYHRLKGAEILIEDDNIIILRFDVLLFEVFRFVRERLENFTCSFFHRSRTSGALLRRCRTSTASLRGSRSATTASRYPRNEIQMVGQT